MDTSVFVFAYDLHDEGYGQVLDTIQQRSGAAGVTLACSYHHARDVFPHNPVRKIRFHEGGAIFFRPQDNHYAGLQMRPYVSSIVAEKDPLETALQEAERRGMVVRAWTNNLHNTTFASRYPQCAVYNAFGDPYITYLCPANPNVRAYLHASTADLARYPVQAILTESVCYQPFDHGYHHERSFVPLSPVVKFLLSLCFCEHCTAAGNAQGADVERIRRFVTNEVGEVFDGEATPIEGMPLEYEPVAALVDGEMSLFLRARQTVISTLVAEMNTAAQAVRPVPVIFMEMSAAFTGGYDTGRPGDNLAVSRTWQDGVDVLAVSSAAQGLSVLGYTRDLERLRADIQAYRTIIPFSIPFSVAIRPMLPDCGSPDELIKKFAVLREYAPDWIDVYHYGLMRLVHLDWVGQALAASG